jgi:PKD repeat protein
MKKKTASNKPHNTMLVMLSSIIVINLLFSAALLQLNQPSSFTRTAEVFDQNPNQDTSSNTSNSGAITQYDELSITFDKTTLSKNETLTVDVWFTPSATKSVEAIVYVLTFDESEFMYLDSQKRLQGYQFLAGLIDDQAGSIISTHFVIDIATAQEFSAQQPVQLASLYFKSLVDNPTQLVQLKADMNSTDVIYVSDNYSVCGNGICEEGEGEHSGTKSCPDCDIYGYGSCPTDCENMVCEYQKVQCVTAPCDPVWSCNTLPFPGELEQAVCIDSGGTWREFADGCVDYCGAGDICTQALTMGCDCGADACWDGYACETSADNNIGCSLTQECSFGYDCYYENGFSQSEGQTGTCRSIEQNVCSDVGVTWEEGEGDFYCCLGLEERAWNTLTGDHICSNSTTRVCMLPDDGICGDGENWCNSSQDCEYETGYKTLTHIHLYVPYYNQNEEMKAVVKIKSVDNAEEEYSYDVRLYHHHDDIFTTEAIDIENLDGMPLSVFVKLEKHWGNAFFYVFADEDNIIDLSNRPMLPGDLPHTNNVQDGRIDVHDFDAIVDRLGSSDQQDLDVADLDYNGIVNTRDVNLLLQTVQIKQDEGI